MISQIDSGQPDEAYLAFAPGKVCVVYFPQGGSVTVDVSDLTNDLMVKWININTGDWGPTSKMDDGMQVKLDAPDVGNWCAIIANQD